MAAGGAINLLTLSSTGNMRDQKTYTLTAGEQKIDLSLKNLGSADVALVATWLKRPAVSAVVARLSLSGNFITGSKEKDYAGSGRWEYDKDLSGLISLCDALLILKNPIELDLSNCGLSVNGVNPIAKAISAGGAVACMTLDGNKTIGATGADSLMESICTTRNTQIVKIKHDVGALQLPFHIVVRTACQIS